MALLLLFGVRKRGERNYISLLLPVRQICFHAKKSDYESGQIVSNHSCVSLAKGINESMNYLEREGYDRIPCLSLYRGEIDISHARVTGRSWRDFLPARMELIKLVVTAQLNVSIREQNIHSS